MITPIPLLVVAGAVLAALLTGVFSFVGLILSKEQKISEARLAWIESLRSDLSAMLSRIETLARLADSHLRSLGRAAFTEKQLLEFREKHKEAYYALEEARNRVTLRLTNSGEHQNLLGYLDTLVRVFRGNCENVTRVYEVQQQIITESQRILKTAWRRVKRGEMIFVLTEIVLSVGILGVLILLALWGNKVLEIVSTAFATGAK
jgi:hypothetical protein